MTTVSPEPPSQLYRFQAAIYFVVLVGVFALLADLVTALDVFPETWNIGLRDPLNEFKRWVVVNRNSHWLFVFFFEPLSATIDFILRRVEDVLLWLPWPIIILSFFIVADRVSGLRLALLVTGCLLLMGLFGLWRQSMQTLALMTIAVLISLAIGIPVGIWAARNDRVDQVLRPILDAMQTLPAFVYLIPVLLFFGVARVPSVVATIIYALPPAIRLTNLGIRSVPPEAIEAAQSFGSTDRQVLYKVQIPMAMPSIMAGINQTIMMALSIVVIAALIGSGGLGDVVLKSLRRLQVGRALEAGLAIVVLAILLDRLSTAFARIDRQSQPHFRGFRLFPEKWRGLAIIEKIELGIEYAYHLGVRWQTQVVNVSSRLLGSRSAWITNRPVKATIVISLIALALPLLLLGVRSFPQAWYIGLNEPTDRLVEWMMVNLYEIGDTGYGTGPLRDFLIIRLFLPLINLMTNIIPWTIIVLVFASLAFATGQSSLTIRVVAMLSVIGLLGMWPFAMDTLAQAIIAVTGCILVGLPVGIWASRSNTADQVLRPILDFLQTIPIFVYLVPVIMLFGTGSVAGLIASILYASVPVIRLTNLGIRQVDEATLEAAESFGSTGLQRLLKVEVPLALPSIMLGINQTIMMVLAMVIIAGLVGATGLGLEVVQGFANDNLGRSIEAGLAIVLLAIVIDRITQAWADKTAEQANV
ncbi:MAG: ABC transporter permease subunit [Chloroflexota bacterium]